VSLRADARIRRDDSAVPQQGSDHRNPISRMLGAAQPAI
jgi:hypothetical protein